MKIFYIPIYIFCVIYIKIILLNLAIKHITEIHTDGMYIDDPNRKIEAYPVKKNENGDFEIQDTNDENNDLAF